MWEEFWEECPLGKRDVISFLLGTAFSWNIFYCWISLISDNGLLKAVTSSPQGILCLPRLSCLFGW